MPHPYYGETRTVPPAAKAGIVTSSPSDWSEAPSPRLGSLDGEAIGRGAAVTPRLGWHTYFLGIARAAAARSDCVRSQVGAVLVRERRVRSTGYNGAPSGMAGCGSCPRSRSTGVAPLTNDYDTPGAPGQCVAVHAEVNAVLYAERSDVVGSTVYVTREPCAACSKTCLAAGVVAIVWPSEDGKGIVYQDLRPDCGERGRSCGVGDLRSPSGEGRACRR